MRAATAPRQRVVIYCRISDDPLDEQAGVGRQERDCRALIQLKQYELIRAPFVENDTSAWNGEPRSDWQEVLRLAEAGEIDGIVTYNIDRIVRRVKDLEKLLDVIKATGGRLCIYTVAGGEVDLSTPGGIMVAQMLAAVAQHESSIKAVRVARAKKQVADDGLPDLGGPRPFGFADNRMDHEPGEAAALRAAARTFLKDGRYDLSAAVRTVRDHGYDMNTRRLRALLLNGRVAGLRDYTSMDERRRRADGKALTYPMLPSQRVQAKWEPIIPRSQWELISSVLADRSRPSTNGSRSLLAGLLVCGRCGAGMTRGGGRYQCSAQRKVSEGRYGCGSVTAREEFLDEGVLQVCAARFSAMPDHPEVPFEDSPVGARYRSLSEDRERLVAAQRNMLRTFATTALALEEPELMSGQVAALQRQIDSIDAQLIELGTVSHVVLKPRKQLELLASADQSQQRRAIDILVEEVIVYPVGQGQKRSKLPYPESWEIWFKGGDRPARTGMAERSARIARAIGQEPVGATAPSAAEVRAWAAAQGYELNPKGRIPKAVRDEYTRAHTTT